MKKIIVLTLLALSLAGCSNNFRAEKVTEAYPGAEIAFVPSHQGDFLVRLNNGAVLYVRCDNPFTGNITSKSVILPATK